ncbi:MAG: hypothetical protein GTN38_03580 [Candidatus Aenigmarchaeota archaeon]|nr:hypothetical protein [Candidatus Aenigmarchaeota archaeon]NIP40742.1 hypothetical protein [Candidatus Aenigmarchaeota archaeon]NIQ18548.1 hypothetical protein [Candidatus Aenigmarchaeota archaeon]NIS73447.1 hypothetical protein [Candidatus Aenigmarchaeota archaeon]
MRFITRRRKEFLSPDSKLAFSGFLESEGLISKKIKIDSKGRISIPSEIRKNFGLEEGVEIELVFDLKRNFVVLVFSNGQDGVCSSTEDCGSSEPGANPGPGPQERKKQTNCFKLKGGEEYG